MSFYYVCMPVIGIKTSLYSFLKIKISLHSFESAQQFGRESVTNGQFLRIYNTYTG